jgi:hypothetical protein
MCYWNWVNCINTILYVTDVCVNCRNMLLWVTGVCVNFTICYFV